MFESSSSYRESRHDEKSGGRAPAKANFQSAGISWRGGAVQAELTGVLLPFLQRVEQFAGRLSRIASADDGADRCHSGGAGGLQFRDAGGVYAAECENRN